MHHPESISVLIPFHNSDETIAETIASVTAQRLDHLEIIIADDHSSADARATLDAIVCGNSMVRIIDVNGRGPSSARNAAAAAASGSIYCFLDADDCLRAGALEAYRQFFKDNRDVGVAFGRVRITDNPSEPGGVVTPCCAKPSLAQIIGENRVCTTSNVVARAEAFSDIGGFDESLSHAEDQEWLARAYKNPRWLLAGIDRVTLDYRTSHGGLSSDLKKMETGWRRMVRTVKHRAQSISHAQIAESTGLFYRYLARRALRLGQSRTDSAMFMIRALAAHPVLLIRETGRTWPTLLGALAVLSFGTAPFRKIFQ